MIINPYFVLPSATYDPDAQAFFTAAGITDTTQKNAVSNLCINLKAAGLWTKMTALYPIVGGSASAHAVNLKTPGTYNLTFATGMTHSSTGMISNGTSGYANTGFNSTLLTSTSMHLSVYSRTQTVGTSIEIGNNISNTYVHVRAAANFVAGNATLSLLTFTTTTDARGFWIGTKRGTTDRENYRNGTTENSTAANDSTAFNNINLFICATNNNGISQLYSTKEIAFSSIGDGLTDLEAQVFNQIVEGYQFALSRNINPSQTFYYNPTYNNETNAFLYSTQITDITTQGAVNTLVNDMKTYGVWSKMRAIYPIVGGTAATHKFNLVNSQDTDTAFRLSFSTGWSHSSTGMTGNGTSAFADSFLIPSTSLSSSNNHLSVYSRTDASSTIVEVGSYTASSPYFYYLMYLKSAGNLYVIANGNTSFPNYNNPDSLGFYLMTKTSASNASAFKNNTKVINNQPVGTGISSHKVFLGAANAAGTASLFSARQISFVSMGDGLTDTEANNFYTAVQNFQTTLGRQV